MISGNSSAGVSIAATASPAGVATGNVVVANLIGTGPLGQVAFANIGDGIDVLNAGGNTIGGVNATTRNVISGNTGLSGINIDFSTADPLVGNVIQGNYVGVDSTGTTAIPNTGNGVHLGTSNNLLLGNVISGNTVGEVVVTNQGITGNLIAGNFIGTDQSGLAVVNSTSTATGIQILVANNTTIGGTTVAAKNVISGNDFGIRTGSGTSTPAR